FSKQKKTRGLPVMKDAVTLLFLLLLFGSEGALWIKNPMHIPADFITARLLGVELFEETGTAMEPTVPAGRHVLVCAWPYLTGSPRIGDVVAFVYSSDPSIADVKRIVATGGSTVEFRDGLLYVDGKRTEESYLRAQPAGNPDSMPPSLVPHDSYFVLADNRAGSEDSRSYGPIGRDRIIGKKCPR
ncbi:MAG TPA: signal peptidase I, partial [Steroidobacteraceae bacterium]